VFFDVVVARSGLNGMLTRLWFDREGGPTIFAQVKNGKGVEHIVDLILSAWKSSGASVGGSAPAANGTK